MLEGAYVNVNTTSAVSGHFHAVGKTSTSAPEGIDFIHLNNFIKFQYFKCNYTQLLFCQLVYTLPVLNGPDFNHIEDIIPLLYNRLE